MHSAIYEGRVRHQRTFPTAHLLSYPVFMVYVDLDELPSVLSQSPLWGQSPWSLARFKRDDFLGPSGLSIKDAVHQRILQETGECLQGPVRVLSNWRYFGHSINPIACYYCFDHDEQLRYIVAEVTNTPWGEQCSYVLQCNPGKKVQRITFEKQMHVSPFNPMNIVYDWTSNTPGETIRIHMRNWTDQQCHFNATLALERNNISPGNLNSALIRYPLMTMKVAGAIYWNALKLWMKGTRFYPHPDSKRPEYDA